jgi:hypothetical protein
MKVLNNKKFLGSVVLGAFLVAGFYNAFVMNADSDLKGMNLVKRLDEVYGVTIEGRKVASEVKWEKIEKAPIAKTIVPGTFGASIVSEKVSDNNPEIAAIQEELTLNLIEVAHASKWKQGLSTAQFSGSLTANNGVIESLNVSLPEGMGISISFTEMIGNVFSYELNGEILSGMMYQIDTNSYMITLTNGPLEGARLRFGGEPSQEAQEKIEMTLAENHHIEVGTFGNTEAPGQVETPSTPADFQFAGFNFNSSKI